MMSSPERSLLLLPQNTDPFTLLNVRGVKVTRKGAGVNWTATKAKKGVAWHRIWKEGMETCERETTCKTVNVLYGHWAGEGLNIQHNSSVPYLSFFLTTDTYITL